MSKKKNILRGLSKIHFAPFLNGVFEIPKPVQYAKSAEFKLNFEDDATRADDTIVDNGFLFTGGEGKLGVLDLTPEEQELILGNKRVKGGAAVNSRNSAPAGAFLFERKFKGSTHKRLYVVYNCVCSNPGIVAQTLEDKAEDSVAEIPLSVSELSTGDIYFYIDTNDSTADAEQIANWYTEVQMPEELDSLPNVKKEK